MKVFYEVLDIFEGGDEICKNQAGEQEIEFRELYWGSERPDNPKEPSDKTKTVYNPRKGYDEEKIKLHIYRQKFQYILTMINIYNGFVSITWSEE